MLIYGSQVVSSVDGPGSRIVIHTAGCSIGCSGCFNTHTHPKVGGLVKDVNPVEYAGIVFNSMIESKSEGVTVSGGEPTDQISELSSFLVELRRLGVDSIIMFTGRELGWLRSRREGWTRIESEELIDVLIDGPFMSRRPEYEMMKGSSNQVIYILTARHCIDEFRTRDSEIKVGKNGDIVWLGFPDQDMLSALQ